MRQEAVRESASDKVALGLALTALHLSPAHRALHSPSPKPAPKSRSTATTSGVSPGNSGVSTVVQRMPRVLDHGRWASFKTAATLLGEGELVACASENGIRQQHVATTANSSDSQRDRRPPRRGRRVVGMPLAVALHCAYNRRPKAAADVRQVKCLICIGFCRSTGEDELGECDFTLDSSVKMSKADRSRCAPAL
jgi:hypothetical protein